MVRSRGPGRPGHRGATHSPLPLRTLGKERGGDTGQDNTHICTSFLFSLYLCFSLAPSHPLFFFSSLSSCSLLSLFLLISPLSPLLCLLHFLPPLPPIAFHPSSPSSLSPQIFTPSPSPFLPSLSLSHFPFSIYFIIYNLLPSIPILSKHFSQIFNLGFTLTTVS